jgi:hypothetical protein
MSRQTMMNNESLYHVAGDSVYVLVGPERLGRVKENLTLTMQLAREKIDTLQPMLDELDEGSEEYERLQERINDYEMLLSDCEGRFEDLMYVPK